MRRRFVRPIVIEQPRKKKQTQCLQIRDLKTATTFRALKKKLCNRTRNEHFEYLKQATKSIFAAVALNNGR
jgi:hypothetical protein